MKMLHLFVLVGIVPLSACGTNQPTKPSNSSQGNPVSKDTAARELARPPADNGFHGTWILEKQEFPSREHAVPWNKMRRLELRTDGTYALGGERESTGRLEIKDGEIWLHQVLRFGVDMRTPPKPTDPEKLATWNERQVVHVNKLEIVEQTTSRLVVMEDDPTMIFGGHFPPGKVKNTYRRRVAGDFGPILGTEIRQYVPTAGTYRSRVLFGKTKYPTRERYSSKTMTGEVVLEVREDSTVELCVASKEREFYTAGKYDRGGEKKREHESLSLVGFGGKWKADGEQISLVFERQVWNRCDLSDTHAFEREPLSLQCKGLRKNDVLPLDAVACRVPENSNFPKQLTINPRDTFRAGPFMYQSGPTVRANIDLGEPWLLLGTGKGFSIRSQDSRSTDHVPRLQIEVATVNLDETKYQPEPVIR